MIYFAYDGSVNGDWVFWYALNLARDDATKRLTVLHVDTGDFTHEEIHTKINAFAAECEAQGVDMSFEMLSCPSPSADCVFVALRKTVPEGDKSLLVCGARLKEGASGYLSGTVSERLLSDQTFPVMAVRVVQPGLLGAPKDFLIPVAGDPEGFHLGADILSRMVEGVRRIHLLRVMMIKRQVFRQLLNHQADGLREKGWVSLKGLDEELARRTGVDKWKIDANVRVSDDWAHEIIIQASRDKTHLILMEASRKGLKGGFLYGNPLEVVLRDAPCDVAIYRGV